MEAESFLGNFETLKEEVSKIKESDTNLFSYRNNLFEVTKIYHHALKREENEAKILSSELDSTYVSWESTQKALQESKLQIYQIQKVFNVPHLLSYM